MLRHGGTAIISWALPLQITEMTSRAAELIAEIQELKGTITKLKLENKRLSVDISALDQKSQCFEKSGFELHLV